VSVPQFQVIWVVATGRLQGYEFGRPAKILESLVDLSATVNPPRTRSHRA
jgi:hypothetical protein